MTELVFIAGLGLIMGIISAISGGSGVFAVPTLLALGLPPVNALALNRLSDVGVVLGAIRNYRRAKSIDWKLAVAMMGPLLVGAIVGASVVVRLPEEILKIVIIGGVLIAIGLLLKSKGKESAVKRVKLGFFLLLLVGVWDGALAMAGATFAVLILVYCFGKNFLQARSTDIIAAIPETFVSASILAWHSTVAPAALFTMFASSFVGAWIGSHLAVKHGSGFIRKAMILIALVMVGKVVLDLRNL